MFMDHAYILNLKSEKAKSLTNLSQIVFGPIGTCLPNVQHSTNAIS